MQEEFEDTKGVIRICKSKKDNQHNGQKKKDNQHNGQKKKDNQHNGQKKKDNQQICTSFKQTRIEKPNQSVPEVDYETE